MKKKKVLIGLSGGIDSFVSALLLQKQGYEVIGVYFMTTKNQKLAEKAQEVAKKLKIKLIIMNTVELFSKTIIQDFLEQYKQGLTPNPCVFCNRIFKFQLLLEAQKEFKTDYIATGHYVIKKENKLYRAKDKNKDQSFFLARLTEKETENALFPLGELTKSEVKEIAKKEGFKEISTEKESQDLCFIEGETIDFLRKNLPKNNQKKGKIINWQTKEEIGEHEGIFSVTIGQRAKIGGQKNPLFIKKIDLEKNIVYVAEDSELYGQKMELSQTNWLQKPKQKEVLVQLRHRAKPIEAKIKILADNKVRIEFAEPVRAITPGQSVAIYNGDQLLGGGVITK